MEDGVVDAGCDGSEVRDDGFEEWWKCQRSRSSRRMRTQAAEKPIERAKRVSKDLGRVN